MRILIFHGWLLRGTGSNVYNASLASALAGLGHDVHLVCQDREVTDLAPPGASGTVTIHNPDIGGLLPVFVRDAYEGFEVKTFSELGDAELERYIDRNVAAVRETVESLGGVDAALANHLIMAPVILRRAGLRYALKVHGSDLSYTVIPDLERFGPYAREACEGAAGILVGSSHIAARLRQAVDAPDTNAKVRLGPPGVDTDLFSLIQPDERRHRLIELSESLADATPAGGTGKGPDRPGKAGAIGNRSRDRTRGQSATWERDSDRAALAVRWYADAPGPRVVFVGKLIVSKGVDLLLAAWPLVYREHPAARLLVVGFGALEKALKEAWEGLAKGDLGPIEKLAERGRGLEGGEDEELRMLKTFLASPPDGYADAARAAAGSVGFAGRLEHREVGELVPAADALVFPSTFPEAFGMVAAEAAAAGVLPVSAAHSGAAEVSRELAATLPGELAGLVSFELDDRAVESIAARLSAWLALDDEERARGREALRATVERRWSWEGVANGVLAAAAGELGGLATPAPGSAS